jgi:hypothetical protein
MEKSEVPQLRLLAHPPPPLSSQYEVSAISLLRRIHHYLLHLHFNLTLLLSNAVTVSPVVAEGGADSANISSFSNSSSSAASSASRSALGQGQRG